jgi:hypothetical protein
MKIIKHKGKEITFYSSIKEMPIERYIILQTYLMQESGIGSTMADVENHFRGIDTFLSSEKIQEAITERQNLHMNIYAALNGINFKSLSFACMIGSIDKQEIGCMEYDLKEAIKKLKGISVGEIEEILTDLKKNCIGN